MHILKNQRLTFNHYSRINNNIMRRLKMPLKKNMFGQTIFQLKITLRGSRPPIWRRIQVPGNITLERLHYIFQNVMGWTNSHLHQFIINGEYYGVPDDDFYTETKNEKRVKLGSVVSTSGEKFIYEYDFGDSWEHLVIVEKVLSPEKDVNYPICLKGKRECPPEDCGGVWGYEELLEAIKDPNHPEYEEWIEWVGDDFDPEFFDIDDVNERLQYFK